MIGISALPAAHQHLYNEDGISRFFNCKHQYGKSFIKLVPMHEVTALKIGNINRFLDSDILRLSDHIN